MCFPHVAQRGAFRRYLLGLLSDSRRKSMSAMLERVRDRGTYQAFQHFITDAPWSADAVWRHLRATIPDRTGVLIFDGTSFPSSPLLRDAPALSAHHANWPKLTSGSNRASISAMLGKKRAGK